MKPDEGVFTRFFRWFYGLFGVHEVLFLAGFSGFFYGIAGIWSMFGAFAVSGAILMGIALAAILIGRKKG